MPSLCHRLNRRGIATRRSNALAPDAESPKRSNPLGFGDGHSQGYGVSRKGAHVGWRWRDALALSHGQPAQGALGPRQPA